MTGCVHFLFPSDRALKLRPLIILSPINNPVHNYLPIVLSNLFHDRELQIERVTKKEIS